MAIQDMPDEEILASLMQVGAMPPPAIPEEKRVQIAEMLDPNGKIKPDFYGANGIGAEGLNKAQERGLVSPDDAALEAAGMNRQDYLLAGGFADRMMAAERILNDPKYQSAAAENGFWDQAAVEYLPSLVSNNLISDDFAMFDQARRDWINAQLRRESGAAIADSEFDNATQQYFAYTGDQPEELNRKRQNRLLSVMSMRRSAGPAYVPVALEEARKAIAAGADPAAVKKRLEEYGILDDMLEFGTKEDGLNPPDVAPMVGSKPDNEILDSLPLK